MTDPITRPCRAYDGHRIIVTTWSSPTRGKGVHVRDFRYWSPGDWWMEVTDWWRVRRHF